MLGAAAEKIGRASRKEKARKLILFFFFSLIGYSVSVPAADQSVLSQTETDRLVKTIIGCVGYYGWAEELQRSSNLSDGADYARTFKNGAALAAAYILSVQRQSEAPGATPRESQHFLDVVSARAEANQLRMRALAESGDDDSIKEQGALCAGLSGAIEGVLDLLRQSTAPPRDAHSSDGEE